MRLSNRDPPQKSNDPSLRNIFFGNTYYQVCSAEHTWYLEAVPELLQLATDRLIQREVRP